MREYLMTTLDRILNRLEKANEQSPILVGIFFWGSFVFFMAGVGFVIYSIIKLSLK
jgi:hypothetical protein